MKKILIVDDEKEALAILERKLKEADYLISAVASGKEAIEVSKLFKPDLILLDIAMPDIDGYTVASALRQDKLLKDVPIIFVTGKELELKGIKERLLEIGICDYITKPCTFDDILKKIKECI